MAQTCFEGSTLQLAVFCHARILLTVSPPVAGSVMRVRAGIASSYRGCCAIHCHQMLSQMSPKKSSLAEDLGSNKGQELHFHSRLNNSAPCSAQSGGVEGMHKPGANPKILERGPLFPPWQLSLAWRELLAFGTMCQSGQCAKCWFLGTRGAF